MLNILTAKIKQLYYQHKENKAYKQIQKEYGIDKHICEKLILIKNDTDLIFKDIYTKPNTPTLSYYQIDKIDLLIELYDNFDDNYVGDRIIINNTKLFFGNVFRTKFEDTEDLFAVGYKLSCIDMPDAVAEAMADVLVLWSTEFKQFYCYKNDTDVIMMWNIMTDQYIFTRCSLINSESIVTYIYTYDICSVLNYIKDSQELRH